MGAGGASGAAGSSGAGGSAGGPSTTVVPTEIQDLLANPGIGHRTFYTNRSARREHPERRADDRLIRALRVGGPRAELGKLPVGRHRRRSGGGEGLEPEALDPRGAVHADPGGTRLATQLGSGRHLGRDGRTEHRRLGSAPAGPKDEGRRCGVRRGHGTALRRRSRHRLRRHLLLGHVRRVAHLDEHHEPQRADPADRGPPVARRSARGRLSQQGPRGRHLRRASVRRRPGGAHPRHRPGGGGLLRLLGRLRRGLEPYGRRLPELDRPRGREQRLEDRADQPRVVQHAGGVGPERRPARVSVGARPPREHGPTSSHRSYRRSGSTTTAT